MKVLVTAGATREPLDAVRFLSNVSTGRTGVALAAELASRGHAVALLHAESVTVPEALCDREAFGSAADLAARLRHRLAGGDIQAVVMTAAVADYRPATPEAGKFDSAAPTRTLELVRNPKLLPQLRGFSPARLRVIGFKLTAGATTDEQAAAVAAQFATAGVDAVVHNDLAEIRRAAVHPFHWHTADGAGRQAVAGVPALAEVIDAFLRRTAP